MRVVLTFLVWLCSFWTWKDLFLRWVRWSPPSPPASGETAREEHLPSQERQQESELSRFLSSLPQDECGSSKVFITEDSKVTIYFGRREFELLHGTNLHSGYRAFLEAVASSKVVFRDGLEVSLWEEESCKHMEAFGDALRQSHNDLRKLDVDCGFDSAIPFAKCVSSAVLGNDSIQDLCFNFGFLNLTMGKVEVIEFMANIALSYNLCILRSFIFYGTPVDKEGGEQLIIPFKSPHNAFEDFGFNSLSLDDQLEHISGMLDTSTSLKKFYINFRYTHSLSKKVFTRGYTNLAIVLYSNQSLNTLICRISSSMELKMLLDPLLPKINNVQCNATLTKLKLFGNIGGKEGTNILVEMLHTSSSLLELVFDQLDELKAVLPQGIENALEILKALKVNKSLKKIGYHDKCTAIGGYKVLGAMMDLLLENHCIEDIDWLRRHKYRELGRC